MSYHQYYIKLIRDYITIQREVVAAYKILSGPKGYLDDREWHTYNDFCKVMYFSVCKCQEIASLMAQGKIKHTDPVDPFKLSFIRGPVLIP